MVKIGQRRSLFYNKFKYKDIKRTQSQKELNENQNIKLCV